MAILQEVKAEPISTSATSVSPRWARSSQSGAALLALAVIDPVCIVAVGFGAVDIGSLADWGLADWGRMGGGRHAAGLGLSAAVLFGATAQLRGLYSDPPAAGGALRIGEALLIWSVVSLCLAFVSMSLQLGAAPHPGILLFFFASGAAALAASRRAVAWMLPATPGTTRRVVVAARHDQPSSSSLARAILGSRRSVCAEVSLPPSADAAGFSEATREIINQARRHRVDEILLALDCTDRCLIEAVTDRLRAVPLPVRLVPDANIGELLQKPLVSLGSAKAIELRRAPLSRRQRIVKRMLDLLIGVLALTALAPVFALIAIMIRMDSRGPVLFRQRRTGFNGSSFGIYKFRTMTTLDDGDVIRQACRGDARVTRVGAILRQHSLDELPQLFNVLRGDMSLVGPRPHALAHDLEYGKAIVQYAVRHSVKPGMTGWAQVNGWRGATPQLGLMIRRVEHDIWYVEHWSVWLDLKILIRTAMGAGGAGNAY